ncbi:MAG TPA: glycosyltransferase [Bacillota bacterium]|nr:glycosyltransferase [Bacillota bacterium]
MAATSSIKSLTKRAIKKGLLVTKKVLSRSKTARRVGRGVRNVLFPGGAALNIYDVSKYMPTIAEYQKQLSTWEHLKYKPLISVVIPTYNTPVRFLEECIDSVLLQSYPNWELCIADDASPNKDVVQTIKRYAAKDKRIKLVQRPKNGHISAATNSAIDIASGEYIALLDHDDVLWPNALYEIVSVLDAQPKTDFVYTDEDKIDAEGKIHSYPFFKPDWSPEFLESCNYITHFSCIRTSLVRDISGFRVGYEGAQDWDLFIRLSEKTEKIVHIPKVLYSWRVHEASTALNTDTKPYVYEAQNKLLVGRVERSGRAGIVKQGVIKQHSSIEYAVVGTPEVSIVLYGDQPDLFKKSVSSLTKRTGYQNVEYVFVTPSAKLAAFASRAVPGRAKKQIIQVAKGTNAAAAYNQAATKAAGEYLAFIDGSMIIRTPRWLELLLGDAQYAPIGAVGGKTIAREKDRFMRAAVSTGIYGLYAHLLEGMPLEDVHYMRGLHGQSRRNVIAVDSGCLLLKRDSFTSAGGFAENLDDMYVVDLCLKLHKSGKRIVYNPYVETIDLQNKTAGDADKARDKDAIVRFQKKWRKEIEYDPYLNPGFTRCNAQLDLN